MRIVVNHQLSCPPHAPETLKLTWKNTGADTEVSGGKPTATTVPPGRIYSNASSYPAADEDMTIAACGPRPSGVAALIAAIMFFSFLKSRKTSTPSDLASFSFSAPVLGGGVGFSPVRCFQPKFLPSTHINTDDSKSKRSSVLNRQMTQTTTTTRCENEENTRTYGWHSVKKACNIPPPPGGRGAPSPHSRKTTHCPILAPLCFNAL